MKNLLFVLILIVKLSAVMGQSGTPLPLQTFYNADTAKPLLFYISGDGGMNKFSTALLQQFNAKGYAVVALDAKSYFWKKKEPQQAANEISTAISQYLNKWQRKSYSIIGYSFGADVLPFIFNRFPKTLQQKTTQLLLLSPSTSTDFEIHLTDMFGFGNKRAESVVSEINKLMKPVVLVFGKEENDFPLNQVTNSNRQIVILPGSHHFDSDTNYLCNQLIAKISK